VPKKQQALVFIGIKGRVVALDRDSGTEVWRAQLGTDYVSVLWDGSALFAVASGEIWRLDPASGNQLWHNQLKGLGRGLVSLASTQMAGAADSAIEYQYQAAAAAAGAAAG
jgi:outer membrane protein assembly factor BamB